MKIWIAVLMAVGVLLMGGCSTAAVPTPVEAESPVEQEPPSPSVLVGSEGAGGNPQPPPEDDPPVTPPADPPVDPPSDPPSDPPPDPPTVNPPPSRQVVLSLGVPGETEGKTDGRRSHAALIGRSYSGVSARSVPAVTYHAEALEGGQFVVRVRMPSNVSVPDGGTCTVQVADSHGYNSLEYLHANGVDIAGFIQVHDDAMDDTDRSVTAWLTSCDLPAWDQAGYAYSVSDDTILVSVLGAVQTADPEPVDYTMSIRTAATSVVEGEAFEFKLDADPFSPRCPRPDGPFTYYCNGGGLGATSIVYIEVEDTALPESTLGPAHCHITDWAGVAENGCRKTRHDWWLGAGWHTFTWEWKTYDTDAVETEERTITLRLWKWERVVSTQTDTRLETWNTKRYFPPGETFSYEGEITLTVVDSE